MWSGPLRCALILGENILRILFLKGEESEEGEGSKNRVGAEAGGFLCWLLFEDVFDVFFVCLSKRPQDAPKTPPRRAQGAQEGPKSGQEAPRRPQTPLQEASCWLLVEAKNH